VDALVALGIAAEPAVWDDPTVDWAGYDLAVIRSTWDYAARRDAFIRWARGVPRLANPAAVVAWNTDKRYLADLAAAGAPVVPTEWVKPGAAWRPAASGEVVVKPAVGAGGVDAGRYDLAAPDQRTLAAAHAARLHAAGRAVLIQPYLPAVDRDGETSLLWLGGRYSHAIRKGPLLTGPDTGVTGLYRDEEITAREPDAAQRTVAQRVLAALPFAAADLLYARVDLLPGPDGAPRLLEVELTEPSLFLRTAPGAAARLAAAIAARLR
jgi:glutathione synthase/RimK-type ligase-like ATP-grasp enzyme